MEIHKPLILLDKPWKPWKQKVLKNHLGLERNLRLWYGIGMREGNGMELKFGLVLKTFGTDAVFVMSEKTVDFCFPTKNRLKST